MDSNTTKKASGFGRVQCVSGLVGLRAENNVLILTKESLCGLTSCLLGSRDLKVRVSAYVFWKDNKYGEYEMDRVPRYYCIRGTITLKPGIYDRISFVCEWLCLSYVWIATKANIMGK